MTEKRIDFKYGACWTVRIEPVDAAERCTALFPESGIATVVIRPPAGGSVLVEFTASCREDIDAGDGMFALAEGLATGGVVSAFMLDTIDSAITAIRVTASAAGARIEVAQ
jgi:hypothetical protein